MPFVIVNVGTNNGYVKHRYGGVTQYDTERGAKIACTKMNKAANGGSTWKIMEVQEFIKNSPAPKMVERVNIMSGQKYMEAEDTPNFCSPASEAYWSM